jgi:hypothetical protein
MKIGLFWDQAIKINSYYVKDGCAYSFKTHTPYTYHHSLSSYCFTATHNYPFLWGDGCFINISEWDTFPDYELDLIFYSCTRAGIDDATKSMYTVDRIRKKYPNAKIIGYTKESTVKPDRMLNWIEHFKECDYIQAETGCDISINTRPEIILQHHPELLELEAQIGKQFNFVNQPINIDYFYNNVYTNEKIFGIFAYQPNPSYRHGNTYKFANYIGNKYNIPVVYKSQYPEICDNMAAPHIGFIKLFSQYLFHFNLDPSTAHPGGQCCQIANVGSINIGGNNESHASLFPNTSGIDETELEKNFVELLNSTDKQIETITYAFQKLNKLYSFDNVKSQIKKLYGVI